MINTPESVKEFINRVTSEKPNDKQKAIFEIEYKTLSQLQELFVKNSKHKAYLYIDKRMGELLNLLEK